VLGGAVVTVTLWATDAKPVAADDLRAYAAFAISSMGKTCGNSEGWTIGADFPSWINGFVLLIALISWLVTAFTPTFSLFCIPAELMSPVPR
jgi:hypothetical protein